MNPALVILLLGGAVLAAAAASSNNSSEASAPKSPLVQDAEALVRIFDLYSRSRGTLSEAECQELAKLNADSKGETFIDELSFAKQVKDSAGKNLLETSDTLFFRAAWGTYNRRFYLPPGVSYDIKKPDIFSAWIADYWPPLFNCTMRYVGGLGTPEGSGLCGKGTLFDGFYRIIGTVDDPNAGVVRGESQLMDIGEGLAEDFKSAIPTVLRAVASVASNYPGIGTAIASGATFLAEVGSGESLENAALASAKAAVPSSLQGAYDVGVGLATTGDLDVKEALTVCLALAISEGVVDGVIIERFETMKKAYNDAKGGAQVLTGSIEVASAAV